MRFHQITITNVASLKGQHTIDFDKIMAHSHLFAITGPTGSGKSTILNAISLALYGQVYKKDSQSSDFVTLGESYGEIELSFSVGLSTYLSKWKLKVKKQNGEDLKRAQLTRELFELLDGVFTPIDKSIEDITRLNFSQFCKTSILNQGEFARFLTSTFTERKEILEKFYHGDQLGLLAPILKSKIQNAQQSKQETLHYIQGLEANLEENTFSKKELDLIKIKKDDNQKQLDFILVQHQLLNELLQLKEKYNQNLKQEEETKKLINKHETEYNIFSIDLDTKEQNFNELKRVFKDLKPKLTNAIKESILLKQIKASTNESINKQQAINEKFHSLDQRLLGLKKEHEILIQSLKNFDCEFLNQMDIQKLRADDAQMKLYQEKTISLRKQIASKKEDIKRAENRSHILKKNINDNQIRKETLLKKLPNSNDQLKAIEKYKQSYFNNKSIYNQLLSEIQILLKEYPKYQANQAGLNKSESTLKVLENKKENIITELRSLEIDRAKSLCLQESLAHGECIICSHKMEELKQSSFLFQKDPHYSSKDLNQVSNDIQTENLKKDNLKHQIGYYLEKESFTFEKLKTILKTPQALTLEHYEKEIQFLQLENEKKYQNNLIQEQQIRELQKNLELCEHNLKNIHEQIFDIQEQFSFYQSEEQKLLSQCQKAESIVESIKNAYSKPVHEIISDYEQFVRFNQDKKILDGNINSVQSQKEQIKVLKQELALEIESQNHLIKEKYEYIQSICSNKDPQAYLNTLENDLEKKSYDLENLKEQKRKLKTEISDKRNRHYLLTEQSQAAQLNLLQLIEKIKSNSLQMPVNASHFNTSVQKISQKLLLLDDKNLDESVFKETFEITTELSNKLRKEQEEVHAEIAKIEAIRQQRKALEQKITEAKKTLKDSDNQLDSYLNLNEIIGKDAFRSYVLSLVEKMLITQTNHELESLCQGRYRIVQDHKRYASEFKIQDHFLDQQTRKISTLSGGETFLVSLAMALALAELTRGEAKLDSLFIDEGFGTLDETTIEQVYNLLQEIQSSGKSIGIISHVQNLTQRLPVNIQLNKDINGLSNINLCLN